MVDRSLPYLIVEARFYDDLADALLEGATSALQAAGATWEILTVPGALEIPAAIAMALKGPRTYAGFVALGAVIRGETRHYEIVSDESARGLMDLAVAFAVPIGNGILTCETEEQAWARARMNEQDKGGGAARAALRMAEVRQAFGTRG